MRGGRIGAKVLVAVVMLWTLVPLLWMLMSSLKPQEDLTSTTPQVAFTPTLEHYKALFSGGNSIGSYAVNSILAAGVSTLIAVGLGTLAGYGLARSKFRGKDHVAFWIISTRMAPIAVSCPQSISVCVTSCEAAIGSVCESGPENVEANA